MGNAAMEEILREYRLIRRLSKRPYEIRPQIGILRKSWEHVGKVLNSAVNNVIVPIKEKDVKIKK